jgi:peroxisomal 2,4-dienoyl-CoA reductase
MSVFRDNLHSGRVAFITGGATGINFGIAKALGSHGAKIFIMSRREEVLQNSCEEMRQMGIEADYAVGDVRDLEQCQQAIAKCVSTYGGLDILVNGAAGNFLCPSEELSAGGFKAVIDIDLIGTYHMCQSALASLKKSEAPVILNISATLHYQGTPMQAHVMAAKAGIDALARNLAVEWAEYGIRVVGIAPGPIGDTEGMRKLAPLGAEKRMIGEVPLRRLGKVEEIGDAALFLTSSAASYITGETLVVDGGAWLYKPPFVDRETYAAIKKQMTSP